MAFKTNTETKFYFLSGSLSDLSKFDFAHLNIQCLKIDSPEFIALLESMKVNEHDSKTINYVSELAEKFKKGPSLYVLLPIDFTKEFKEKDLFFCYEVILLLYPSDISIYGILEFQLFDFKHLDWTIFTEFGEKYSFGYNLYENHLLFDESSLNNINRYIKIYHVRVKHISYLEVATQSYISSFSEANPTMSFLSLCICLESIIDGTNELIYRIKRNVSILCGDSKERAEIIFKNINLIYKLRSKIVHGENVDVEKVENYLPYLRNLVSRMIIKLILLNIKTKKQLDNILTFSGFGSVNEFSEDFVNIEPNLSSTVDTFRTELPK